MTMMMPMYLSIRGSEKELSFQEMLFVFGSIHQFWRFLIVRSHTITTWVRLSFMTVYVKLVQVHLAVVDP
jgi:hypothetical protein